MPRATEYIVVRQVATGEIRVTRIVKGFVPRPDPAYRWGGPYKSRKSANDAVLTEDAKLWGQLYAK